MLSSIETALALTLRRRVRLASGRSDGRCGKVAEAIAAELGWGYRWGHLRLKDATICWIHCWNQCDDGTVVDATADQFEERWLGDIVVLASASPLHSNYRSAPPGYFFRTECQSDHLHLLARHRGPDGAQAPDERLVATAADTAAGWAALGASAVHLHSGWSLMAWVGEEAGVLLREAAATDQALASRDLEFALDTTSRQRRIAGHGEWASPEWQEVHRMR